MHDFWSVIRLFWNVGPPLGKYIRREKEPKRPSEVRSRDAQQNMYAKLHGLSLEIGVDIWTFVRKTRVFCVVIRNYLVLV